MDFRNSVSFTALLKAFALCKAGATAVEYTVGALAIGVVAVSAAQNMNTGIKGTASAEFSGLSYVAPHEDTPAIETCDKCETPPYVPPIDNAPVEFNGTSGNDTLTGNAKDNIMRGYEGADSLFGGAGADLLIGGAGADTLSGGEGADTASYQDSDKGVQTSLDSSMTCNSGKGGGSDDSCGDTYASIENLTGTAYQDVLGGDASSNTIYGLDGDDTIQAREGDDKLYGGEGNDLLFGEGGNDIIYGENGSDDLQGGDGNDELYGGAETDTLAGGVGADYLEGGEGVDIAMYSTSSAGVSLNLQTGTGTGGDAQGDTLVSIEHLYGSNYNDTLVGNNDANALSGGEGNDSISGAGGNDNIEGGLGEDSLNGDDGDDLISGAAGNDTLNGGAGADEIRPGSGTDVIDGGTGTDTASYSDTGYGNPGVTINLANPALNTGWAAGDTYTNIERFVGGYWGNNSFIGNNGNDWFQGGLKNDTFNGGAGDDYLNGWTDDTSASVDTYQFDGIASEGNDTIQNFTSPGDNIAFSNPAINSSNFSYSLSWSGNDRILTYAGGTIKINQGRWSSWHVPKMVFADGSSIVIDYTWP